MESEMNHQIIGIDLTREEGEPQFDVVALYLSDDEIAALRSTLKDAEFFIADFETDIIAYSSYIGIINIDKISANEEESLMSFFEDLGVLDENIVFYGEKAANRKSKITGIQYFSTFEQVCDRIGFVLIDAKRKTKKTKTYSRMIADCMIILRLIRDNPYISSQRILDNMEFGYNIRTIQRYINTLRMTGEWIEYDLEKRGWYLIENKSLLLGEFT